MRDDTRAKSGLRSFALVFCPCISIVIIIIIIITIGDPHARPISERFVIVIIRDDLLFFIEVKLLPRFWWLSLPKPVSRSVRYTFLSLHAATFVHGHCLFNSVFISLEIVCVCVCDNFTSYPHALPRLKGLRSGYFIPNGELCFGLVPLGYVLGEMRRKGN